MDASGPSYEHLKVIVYLAGIGWMPGKQLFQVPCSVYGSCKAAGHHAQGHTDA